MREIKFRAWDKERNRMSEVPFNIGGTGRICGVAFFNNDLIPIEVIENEPNRYEIMQYTGLKDKNGKEIYEGDIVLHQKMEESFEYRFIDGSFKAIEITDGGEDWNISKNDLTNYCEVIGNIYENPELLNKEVSDEPAT